MPNEELVQELRGYLPDQFHRQLLDGSLQVLRLVNNPVRAHLFAAGLRELFSMSLQTLAPDELVRKCAWFKQADNTDGLTRRQRALYATQGGLHNEFLREELCIEPDELHKNLSKDFGELNKQTHVRPETLMTNEDEIEAFADRAVGALNDVFGSIRDLRKQLVDAIEAHIYREAVDALVSEAIRSLNLLATRYSIKAVLTDQTHVREIDAEIIKYEATGTVDVELQYGSGSDFRKGEGATLDQCFPFRCEISAPVESPYSFYSELTVVDVDTSEWYE